MRKRSELKPGDRVRLIKPYATYGRPVAKLFEVGAEGYVSRRWFSDTEVTDDQVVITWDNGGYREDEFRNLSNGHWVDVDCLENLDEVSKAEVNAAIESIKEALR